MSHLHGKTSPWLLCKYILSGYGPQPWPYVRFDIFFDRRVCIQKCPLSQAGISPLEIHSFVRIMSIFPMKFRYLDIEGTGVLSSTSPSVGFVWLIPCHGEGTHGQRQIEWYGGWEEAQYSMQKIVTVIDTFQVNRETLTT